MLIKLFGSNKKMCDFYIGGPMRGYKDLNKAMFALVARLIRDSGFSVWSPSEHNSYLELSFAECMTADLNAVINDCRKIALLPGWKESLGANMEAFVAFACGKEAVEVVLSEDRMSVGLVPFDLADYCLPYKRDHDRRFNPHQCSLDSFGTSGGADA